MSTIDYSGKNIFGNSCPKGSKADVSKPTRKIRITATTEDGEVLDLVTVEVEDQYNKIGFRAQHGENGFDDGTLYLGKHSV
jgi:hypothetical protein